MTSVESSPSIQRSRSELSTGEREALVDALTPYVDSAVRAAEQSTAAELRPYAVLVGLMGVLLVQSSEYHDEEFEGLILQPAEILHLRKMIGLETRVVKNPSRSVEGGKEFWKAVTTELEAEMAKAKTFPKSMTSLPRSYRSAWNDLQTLKANLAELEQTREQHAPDFLMEALRASMAARQRVK